MGFAKRQYTEMTSGRSSRSRGSVSYGASGASGGGASGGGGGNAAVRCGMRITESFFDAAAVIDAMDRATHKRLVSYGAYTRRVARSSIRRVAETTPPQAAGKPPRDRTGVLKKSILFYADKARRNVIIGPTLGGRYAGGLANLEFGGIARKPYFYKTKRKSLRRRRDKRGRLREFKVVDTVEVPAGTRIAPHPFMGPAQEKARTKLPAMWRNSIRG